MTHAGTAIAPRRIARKSGTPPSRGLPVKIMKLGSLMIVLGTLVVVAPSAGRCMNGLPHRPRIGFSIKQGGNQLTAPVSPVYFASLAGRPVGVSLKPSARSTLATIFGALFSGRDYVSRPKARTNIPVRKLNLESKGPKLERPPVAQPTAPPTEKAASFITPVATPTAPSSQSPPIAPILTPSPGASKINDLPVVTLE